jgi:hypothetical protein
MTGILFLTLFYSLYYSQFAFYFQDDTLYLQAKDTMQVTLYNGICRTLDKFNPFGDNTELLLDLLNEMEFYYLPDVNHKYSVISDTVMLQRKYHFGISSETKIVSISTINK